MNIQMGMPIVLDDASKLEGHGLYVGQKGMANSVMHIDGIDYIYFMPDDQAKMYAMVASRCSIDEERIEEWKKNKGS